MLRNLTRGIMILCLIPMLAAIIGCGGGDSPSSVIHPQPELPLFMASQKGEDVLVTLPDGTDGLSDLKEAAKKSATDHSTISIGVQEADSDASSSRYRMGKYYYDFRWEKHMIYGCINRDVWHISLHLKDTTPPEREIVNLHLVVWWDNGPQFGIYNSANGACAKTEGKFTAIRNKINDFLSRMTPMPSWACYSIAYTAAVVVVVIFALSWA